MGLNFLSTTELAFTSYITPELKAMAAEIEASGITILPEFGLDPGIDLLGLEQASLHSLGRYTMRWPGHCAFRKAIVDLHLLDEEPVLVDGTAVNPQHFMAAVMSPYLQYADDEQNKPALTPQFHCSSPPTASICSLAVALRTPSTHEYQLSTHGTRTE